MLYPTARLTDDEEPSVQGEVRFLIREAIDNVTKAITTSERREDFRWLCDSLLALKNAEWEVMRG